MQTKQCGNSNLHLPILGIGCWSFGEGEYWGQSDQKAIENMVHYAIDQGCNYFDTAEVYNDGTSESALSKALQNISRDKVIIGTKISPSNTAPDTLVEHCHASLKRLQTDYIDLYMVHWPITAHAIRHFTTATADMPVPNVSDAFATLKKLQQAGKIRYIGVSNFGRTKIDEALSTGIEIAINELPYSLLTRAIEIDVLPYCHEKGIGVLGYMSLMQGVLAGMYPTLDDVPLWQRRTRHFDSRRSPKSRHGLEGAENATTQALKAITEIANQTNFSLPVLALQWAMARRGITSSLCGVRSIEKLKQNIEAALTPLDPVIHAALNQVTQPLQDILGPGFDYFEHPMNDRTQ